MNVLLIYAICLNASPAKRLFSTKIMRAYTQDVSGTLCQQSGENYPGNPHLGGQDVYRNDCASPGRSDILFGLKASVTAIPDERCTLSPSPKSDRLPHF